MSNTDILIKKVAFDIISVIAICSLFNNLDLNIRFNNKIYPIYSNFVGFGISIYILKKYI